jgi:hypothetical protein
MATSFFLIKKEAKNQELKVSAEEAHTFNSQHDADSMMHKKVKRNIKKQI